MGWLDNRAARVVGTSPAIVAALVAHGAALVAEGDCDILVHIAPPPPVRLAHDLSHADWRATLDAGLDQRFLLARDFAAGRRAAGRRAAGGSGGGAVVFVGAPEQALGADQAAAAGALGNLTKTLGVEWARDGIRVNAVLTVEDTAALGNFVAYLASDYAAYVTGSVTGIGLDD